MKIKEINIIQLIARNYFLLFQLYIVVYVFINSYINFWFTLNEDSFYEFEKLIIINFFQAEILFFYLIYSKIRTSNRFNEFKKIYENYVVEMDRQKVKKKASSIILIFTLLFILCILGFLISKTAFGNFFKIFLGLNQILLNETKFWLPCLIFLVSFYLNIKYTKSNDIEMSINRLKVLVNAFLYAIPIFVLLFLVRYYLTKNSDASLFASGLLAINLSFLLNIIILKYKRKV